MTGMNSISILFDISQKFLLDFQFSNITEFIVVLTVVVREYTVFI